MAGGFGLTIDPEKRGEFLKNTTAEIGKKLFPGAAGPPESAFKDIPGAIGEAAALGAGSLMGTYEAGQEGAQRLAAGIGRQGRFPVETQAALMTEQYNVPEPAGKPTVAPITSPPTNLPAPAASMAPTPNPNAPAAPQPPTPPKIGMRSEADRLREIAETRVPGTEMGWKESATKAGIGGTITDMSGKVLATVPKAGGINETDLNAQIDAMINKILQPDAGGLKRSQRKNAVELLQAKVGLAGHKEAAEARMDYQKANLEERVRHNRLLEQDMALRLSQQKDINQAKLAEQHYQKFLAQEFDPLTGKAVNNELHTLLNMGMSNLPVPEPFKSSVERAMKGFEEYYKKGLGKGQDTPQKRLQAMQTYKKWTSLLRQDENK